MREKKSLGLGSGSVPTGIIPGEIPNRIPTEDSLSRSNSLFGVDQERMYHPARGMSSTEREKSNDTKYEVDFNKEVQVCKDKWDCMPRWEKCVKCVDYFNCTPIMKNPYKTNFDSFD